MEIFADVLFVINFSMDFLALFLTGKILSMPVRGKRLAAASALGSVRSSADRVSGKRRRPGCVGTRDYLGRSRHVPCRL